MPAADIPSAADGNTLRAEVAQAQKLIAEGAQIGTTPAAESAASAAPPCRPTAAESPFDTAFQAVVTALPLGDSGVATTSSASSSVHAGGSEAAVATVVTADLDSANEMSQAGSATAGAQFTI